MKAAGGEEDEKDVALLVMWQLQAWWLYVLPPRHSVSAAVAACSVQGGWAAEPFVFMLGLLKEA